MIFDATTTKEIVSIAKRHGIRRVSVFGSSLIIEAPRGFTLIDLVSFEDEVKAILGTDVDIVTPGSLHPDAKLQIVRESVQIYPNPFSEVSTPS